ncbi:Gag-pol fusion protein [Phytophthora megakarya]|uniref:Gag-pol fusion protein n=1 Tax=Phytophthora megakarya TaxID=4795 RepID=A0A225WIW9_9STRA|nr:Gag-pol fusion protein [Phytophthora megakarya]
MILRLIPFLEHGENEPMPEADTVRMFRLGMPINWQVKITGFLEHLTEMAAMLSAMKKRQDEEFAAMHFYSDDRSNTLAAMSPAVAQSPDKEDAKMVVQIQVGKTRVTALLDTGCTSSAIDRATATMTKYDISLRPAVANFLNTDGSPGTTTHNAEATFKMLDFSHSRTCSHEFRVADKLLYPVMLGQDFMQKQRMVLDFDRRIIDWDGIEIPMTKPCPTKSFQAAVLAFDTECRAEINVDEPQEVPLESMLSEAELTHTQETEVMNFVNEFSDLFTSSLGTMKKKPYVLPLTPDAKPIASRPFPIPRAYYDATRAEIHRLIDIGVFGEGFDIPVSISSFCCPEEGWVGATRVRFQEIEPGPAAQPLPDEGCQRDGSLGEQPKYKSVFGVPLSYYTRVLARKSRAATTITTPLGKFVFVRLPMGVAIAPDEFQACMDEKLGDLEYVRVYLDDIMITSSSFAEHLEHLAVFFHRLRDFGMTFHRKKSKICAKVVEYLGYQLTKNGIAALPNKVAVITPPRNRREVRRFVGMVNFYGDMIPRRAELLGPLTRLTSPTRTFQ